MRFARIHPGFIIFFVLSFLCTVAALYTTLLAIGEKNATDIMKEFTVAIVLAIAGLTTMLGAVGFQAGRVRPAPVTPTNWPPQAPAAPQAHVAAQASAAPQAAWVAPPAGVPPYPPIQGGYDPGPQPR